MADNKKGNFLVPLATLTTLFFMWGFITCMNDILIPYMKTVFQLTHFQSNLVQFAFFAAYFIISLLYFVVSAVASDPIRTIGHKNMIGSGLLISAAACFLFFFEAKSDAPTFAVFLSALFLLGTGFTFLQIAANPLVAQLGSAETSSSRLNLSQAFNSLGTALAPPIGGYLVFKYFGETLQGASAVQIPYLVLASVLLFLAGIIFFAEIPDVENKEEETSNDPIGALKHPNLIFGMIGIFCYVGGEVAIGSNLVSLMKEVHGIPELQASSLLSFYWGGAMIGRFMGSISMSEMKWPKKYALMAIVGAGAFAVILLITRMKPAETFYFMFFVALNFLVFIMAKSVPSRTLGMFAVVNMALIVVMLTTQGAASLWTILSVGLFNSIMFSNVFTLGIRSLGKYTSQGSSLLVMMILGGAVVPPLQGLLADIFNSQVAFAAPLACYAYLAWYGFVGCNLKREEQHNDNN